MASAALPEAQQHHLAAHQERCPLPSPSSRRAIALIGPRLKPWSVFHGLEEDRGSTWRGYKGGEAYWAASLDYVLRVELGFEVDWFEHVHGGGSYPDVLPNSTLLGHSEAQTRRYHRLIVDGVGDHHTNDKLHHLLKIRTATADMCRIRSLYFWGGFRPEEKLLPTGVKPSSRGFGPRWSVSPFMDNVNTPLPFFAHSQVTLPTSRSAHRARAGFVLGKACDLFKDARVPALMKALHSDGYELHAIQNCSHAFGGVPLVTHGVLEPNAFSLVLRRMAFVVGFGLPLDSPTPVEAIANGAAFLNPLLDKYLPERRLQHRPLGSLGPPYVYTVDLSNASSLLRAAHMATQHRFAGFVPFEHRLETAVAAVCANLVQHDALCTCSNGVPNGTDSGAACEAEGTALQSYIGSPHQPVARG